MQKAKEIIRCLLQPAFLICVLILGISASTMTIAIEHFNVSLEKVPLPLRKSLDLLEEHDLSPYRIIGKRKIENKEIVKALGTEEYIQWTLEDTDLPKGSPLRKCILFITYYDSPDRVPHVPEECYTGSGYQRMASESVKFKIAGIESGGTEDSLSEIPGKHLVFAPTKATVWQSKEKFPVLYFFKVNGVYAGSREDARFALNKNIFRDSSYFSKIEIAFSSGTESTDQAVLACEKLLRVILPVLEKEHWPEW